MKALFRSILVLFFMLCACSMVWAETTPSQMWNSYTVDFPVLKKQKLNWETLFETRFNEDMSSLYRYQFYLGPMYKGIEYLTLGVKYGFIDEEKSGEFLPENRIMLYIVPRCKLSDLRVKKWPGKFQFSIENRFDFRFRSYLDPSFSWRFRVYPSISYPVYESDNLLIEPSIRQAVYFDCYPESIYFSQWRTYAGVAFLIRKHVQTGLFFMWLESRKGPDAEWTGYPILGTILGYRF